MPGTAAAVAAETMGAAITRAGTRPLAVCERSFNSNNSNKSFAQKNSNFQNGGQKQFTAKTFGQPIPAKNGNTGINGSGLPDQVVPFKNGNTGFTGKGQQINSGRRAFDTNKPPTTGAGAGAATTTLQNKSFTQSLKNNSSLNANSAAKKNGNFISGLDSKKAAMKTNQVGDFKKLSNSAKGDASTKSLAGDTVQKNSWKQFQDAKVMNSNKVKSLDKTTGALQDTGIKAGDFNKVVQKDKPSSPTGPIFDKNGNVVPANGQVGKFGDLKRNKDLDKVVFGDAKGTGTGGTGTGMGGTGTGGGGTGTGGGGTGTGGTGTGGTGTGGGTGGGTGTGGTGGGGMGTGGGGMGTGGGGGMGNGMGGGKHGHGFPWWAFVTPAFGYPGYNNGYGQSGVYQQPVYNNAPVYNDAPVVDQAPVTPANYTAPVPAPAAAQPTGAQPVNQKSDGYIDLVLEDVEFLEPATITVGPLYLVKVRNQGTARTDKFRIGAFAQLEGELSDDAPRATTEVTSLGAGETASVTLRLPATAMKLISTLSAKAAAFNQLLVVVDLDDAVTEIEKSNNVANLDRAALEAAAATH